MKKRHLITTTLAIVLFFLSTSIHAQQQETVGTVEKYIIEMNYLLNLPEGYNPNDTITKWPMILFLHGGGEVNCDAATLTMYGPPKRIKEGKNLPFIVVSPVSRHYGWWEPKELIGLIRDDILKKYQVDEERIYMTGLSMGGFGTWNMAAEFPSVFAAIAPVCGGGDPKNDHKYRHMPIWCFHGAKDNVVHIDNSQNIVDAARVYNPGIKFTVYPEIDHDSWTPAYDTDELYDWFLQHKRFRYEQVPVAEEILKKYEGRYETEDGTRRIDFSVFEKGLQGMSDNNPNWTFPMKPASDIEFFFNETHHESFVFEFDENKNVIGFTTLGYQKDFFKKINP